MRSLHVAIVVLSLASLVDAAAGTNRTPVMGTPLIVGQPVPRFILTARIDIDRDAPGLSNRDVMDRVQCRVLPGQFVPVSEDSKGVYYQGAHGIQRLGATSAESGGLYVSKTRAQWALPSSGMLVPPEPSHWSIRRASRRTICAN